MVVRKLRPPESDFDRGGSQCTQSRPSERGVRRHRRAADGSSFGGKRSSARLLSPPFSSLVTAAAANVPLTRVSSDPFTNSDQPARHRGRAGHVRLRVVPSWRGFQVGRFFDGGATDIGFVRSGDGGATWDAPGFLPGHDVQLRRRAPFERVSDASVAYDAAHATWLISSIPLLPSTSDRPHRVREPLDR